MSSIRNISKLTETLYASISLTPPLLKPVLKANTVANDANGYVSWAKSYKQMTGIMLALIAKIGALKYLFGTLHAFSSWCAILTSQPTIDL